MLLGSKRTALTIALGFGLGTALAAMGCSGDEFSRAGEEPAGSGGSSGAGGSSGEAGSSGGRGAAGGATGGSGGATGGSGGATGGTGGATGGSGGATGGSGGATGGTGGATGGSGGVTGGSGGVTGGTGGVTGGTGGATGGSGGATGGGGGSPTGCGNGTLQPSEKCDDTNLVNGDGCNPTCDLWGTVTTLAGSAANSGTSDGLGSFAQFNAPSGITTDGTFLYVSDTANCTIRKVEIANGNVTTLAGSPGVCDHADGMPSLARFNVAQGIAYYNGHVYVADTNNHVIRQVDAVTGDTVTVAGVARVSGSFDAVGNGARFAEPRGIAASGGSLYVADFGNHTIRRVVISNWAVTTLAGLAGTPGPADGTGSAARFNAPRGIAVSGSDVYVADSGNNTIRHLDPTSGLVTTVAGQAGSPGSLDGVGAAARFTSPYGIAVDAESIYVADNGDHTIRQIIIGSWDVTTLCGLAGANASVDATGSLARLDGPWGLAFDPLLGPPTQRLYVAEAGGHTIRIIE